MQKTSLLTATFMTVVVAAGAASAAPQTMILPQLTNPSPVKTETLKFEPFKGEVIGQIKTASRQQAPLLTGRSAYHDNERSRRTGRIGFARGEDGVSFGRTRGYAALVGDHASGLGFYPLQERYKAGADRYRWTHPYWGAPGYGRYGNPVQQAIIADSIRYGTFAPPSSAVDGYRYGVFDPIAGVGTPFFAGYYSAGTRDAEDGPSPLLGNPLN